jgi:hypothetical protein
MKEAWKPVAGYEGLYEVSNLGRVRRTRVIQDGEVTQGYRAVILSKGGERKLFLVHRLVATAFCEKPSGCDVVNHIDNNPKNNRVENLEWVTQKANVHHAASVGVRTIRKIERTDGTTTVVYPTMHSVGRDGFSTTAVRACCRGENKSHKGFTWRYLDEPTQGGASVNCSKFTDFGLVVKTELLRQGKEQRWLEEAVSEKTGLYVDCGYMYKILTGQRKSPKIVAAICEILNIAIPEVE